MADVIEVKYGGHTLSKNHVAHLIKQGIKFDVPPSLFICQLYYESNWGNSAIGRTNNNWGGLTWTGNPKRPSGIVVKRGSPRPSNEGGYYMYFDSVNDYLTDYVYLLTEQGLYNVKGHDTFEDTVRGLFKAGGASADYAATGVTNYTNTMVAVRNGMNNNNNNFLTNIDNNPNDYVDGSTDPDPDPNPPNPNIPLDLSGVLKFFDSFGSGLIEEIEKMLIVNLFDYGNSHVKGNDFLKIEKTFSNTYKITPNINFNNMIDDVISSGKDTISKLLRDIVSNPDPNPDPDPDPEPDPNDKEMYFPVDYSKGGINFWHPPYVSGSTQEAMEFGHQRSATRKHAGYDIGGGGVTGHKVYAIRSGEVTFVGNEGTRGFVIRINHSSDKYHSMYMHLVVGSNKVSVGDTVQAGQHIGTMGDTPNGMYSIHLHVEIDETGEFKGHDYQINPRPYLKVTGNNKTSLPNPAK